MCLCIDRNWREKTEKFRNSSKTLVGYKILEVKAGRYYSPFRNFEFEVGETYSSSRDSNTLDKEEARFLRINRGFHFYINVENYICQLENKICPYWMPESYECGTNDHILCYAKYSWFEFKIKPENLVAIGIYDGHHSFVATKCKILNIS